MKKKRIASKLLSLLLAAAVIVSSSFSGITLMDVSATQAAEQETVAVSDNSVTDVTEDDASTVSENDTDVTEEDMEEQPAEEIEPETEDPVGGVPELPVPGKNDVEPALTTPVTTLVPSPQLRTTLLHVYNKQHSASLTMNSFKLSHLKNITVDLDVAEAATAAGVTPSTILNCVGIGYVGSTVIDISGTGITEIAESEFTHTNNKTLTKIVLPDTLTGIRLSAFEGCKKLAEVDVVLANGQVVDNTLPKSLVRENMGNNIFSGCESLTSFTIPAFSNGYALEIAVGIFTNCTGLENVTISKNVKVIPNSAFYGAGSDDGMTVTIEANSALEKIYDGAFQYAAIESINLSMCTKLERIGNQAFAAPENTAAETPKFRPVQLSKVILPQTTKLEIGDEAFFRTPLKAMYVGSAVEKVVLPDYVTKLGKAAFYENTVMTDLVLSKKLDRIRPFTFYGCTALENVTLASGGCSITAIDNMAFYGTTQLTNADFIGNMDKLVTIGEETGWVVDEEEAYKEVEEEKNKGIWELDYFEERKSGRYYGSYVFRGSGITSLTLPASLRRVNAASFSKAMKLTTVTWSGTVTQDGHEIVLDTMAFHGCLSLTKFVYPVTQGTKSTFTIGGRCFALDKELVIFSPYNVSNANGSKNALPVTLTSIKGGAFADCHALPAMKLTENTAGAAPELGMWLFAFCYNLKSAVLPSKLTEIPKNMYFDCGLTALPSFTGSSNAVKKIGRAAFFGNKIPMVDLTVFPKLETIEDAAFAYVDVHSDRDDDIVLYADELESQGGSGPVLTKVIFPDKPASSNGLKVGDSIFQAAKSFTTMLTPSKGTNGEVFIPNYMVQKNFGDAVFADTSVSKAKWEYTTLSSGANKWNAIPDGMFAMTKVAKLSDACIPAADLTKIGGETYATTLMTEADLSVYPNLATIGIGAFSNNFYLKKVKFVNNGKISEIPKYMYHVGDFEADNYLTWTESYDDVMKSALTEVDFGSATAVGDYAFACMDAVNDLILYKATLPTVSFAGSSVTTIGLNSFAGQNSLRTLDLDGVEVIGDGGFQCCTSLDMTNTPMADTVAKIGDAAFYSCQSLGKVTFGAGLQSIGAEAFSKCASIDEDNWTMEEGEGLTAVDFSRSIQLSTIGKDAFKQSALEIFDISATATEMLNGGALTDCPYLKEVYLNETMQKVAANSVNGCVRLKKFSFFSATTVEKTAFKTKGKFANEKGSYVTPLGKGNSTFVVNAVPLNVGLGSAMTFPYYVNTTSNSDGSFGEITIGSSTNTDANVQRYVKISGDISAYYKLKGNVQTAIPEDGVYFERTDALEYTTKSNSKVYTFSIEGLEKTPEGKTIPLTITAQYQFESGDSSQTQQVPVDISVTYDLKVMDIPYYPTMYSDNARTKLYDVKVDPKTGKTTGNLNLRANAKNSTGKMTFYYTITNLYESNWQPENGNLIIKTSNPSVVKATGSSLTQVDASTWKLKAEYTKTTGTDVYKATSGKKFELTPQSTGGCVITIYPEGSPQTSITLNVKVSADVKSVTLSAPSEFKAGAQKGSKFSIVEKISLYLGKTLSRADGNLGTLSACTDNVVTYSSSSPSVASIDANGTVTIHKISSTKVPVTFTATVRLSTGGTLKKTFVYNVVYPVLAKGKEITMPSGEVVEVTVKPSGKTAGEVSYVAPKSGAKSVTIPATMVVSGKTCKVTSVAASAFENNKTITSVTIGKNVKTISKKAFKGCTKLTSVTFKGKVTSIGESAFEKCKALKKIVIPKTVKEIGKKAFLGCTKLATVTFKTKSKLEKIGDSAFQGCTALKKLTIPSTYLKMIGAKAFYKCKKLKTIVVKSKKVTKVGSNAFKGINAKAVIDVPNSKLSTYKKLFKKGQGKKVKIK